MRKTYTLDEESLRIIEGEQDRLGLNTPSKALQYILKEHAKKREKEELIRDALEQYDKRCRGFNDNLMLSVRGAENNSGVILEFINTLLFHAHYGEIDGAVLTDFAEHPILADISSSIHKKIGKNKQRKDNKPQGK